MFAFRCLFGLALCAVSAIAQPQAEFEIGGRSVQIHGFATQGFLYSNHNNYLTAKTSAGSFAFTDAGGNISARLTPKLRIGAQMYLRNVGQLGNWHPILDWGMADYRMKDWFGLRGGKVKTTLGLFNDTQDNEFLHTWALLPQSLYPLDLRGANLAHLGGDAYGSISVKRAGHLEYTVYGGARPFDPYGGYPYSLHSELSIPGAAFRLKSESGTVIGEDLRWVTPLGLTVGASHATFGYQNRGVGEPGNFFAGTTSAHTAKNFSNAFYLDYTHARFRFFAEYQGYWEDDHIYAIIPNVGRIPAFQNAVSRKSWYAATTYRISSRLELGTYYSRFGGRSLSPGTSIGTHLYDYTMTARFDLKPYWDLKVEGHFMDGVPLFTLRGFYAGVNPNGFHNDTRLLVVRTGFAF